MFMLCVRQDHLFDNQLKKLVKTVLAQNKEGILPVATLT